MSDKAKPEVVVLSKEDMEKLSEEAKMRITHAKMRINTGEPFYAPTLCNMRIREDWGIPTMCTNGVEIRYNPHFTMKVCGPDEVCGVLIHECRHVMLCHMTRRGKRDPMGWNIATDKRINTDIGNVTSNMGSDWRSAMYKIPAGCIPPDPSIGDKCSEAIYETLPKNKDGSYKMPGNGAGDVEDAPGDVDPQELENKIKQAIANGYAIAKMQGRVPYGADKMVDEILDPKLSWDQVLITAVIDKIKDDYTMKRPNQRYMQTGFFLPSLDNDVIGPIVVGNDTSGSMWDEKTLSTGLGVCQSLLDTLKPRKMVVADIDAQVHNWREYTHGDKLPLDIKGGGGSSTIPLFDRIAQEEDEPAAVIIFTDLYIDMPADPPPYPVYWVCTTDQVAKWGETIHVKVD